MKILYEDNHIIAVDKPSGMLVQSDYTGVESLAEKVKLFIKNRDGKPGNVFTGIVHRLDRPVSGALIFAKTSKAAARLSSSFRDRDVVKIYAAVVTGNKIRGGDSWHKLEGRLYRNRDISEIIKDDEGDEGDDYSSKDVSLEYIEISRRGGSSLILVRLHTGRKHQIRSQAAAESMPVYGDTKYGHPVHLQKDRIALHSHYIRVKHPTQDKQVTIISEIPRWFADIADTGQEALKKIKEIISVI